MTLRTLVLTLVAAAALTATSPAAAADRLAAVSLDGRGATVYSGTSGLPTQRLVPGADRAALSPDASLLAYTRRVGGIVHIRVTRVAGGSDRLIARVKPFDIALAFSPDGARLA
jgi:hypothetical protein